MSLQFYYVGISIYGWYFWRSSQKNNKTETVPIKRSTLKELVIFVAITGILSIIIGYGLDKYTDSPLPFWDAFTTAGSIVATWMLARKYLEQWLFWIVIDLVSLGTYIYKDLYPTVILFSVYSGMAVIGYYKWRKELLKQTAH
jgi:nicotinamide mononucleotide transporter